MYSGTLKSLITCHLSQIPGWRTNRKIVVIESDDWGSIRVQSPAAFQRMKSAGLEVDKKHYDTVDALESNDDLECLFEVLTEFKDVQGSHPVFTPMCIMGNPDFDRIEAAGFANYFFQPLEETLKEYPRHDQVLKLWRQGQEARLFVPALHGREHLNVVRYLRLLQSGDEGIRVAFANRSVGASVFKGKTYPNYLGALFPESSAEVVELHTCLREAGYLFEQYCGQKPVAFIAPNSEEPKELETTLQEIGVRYITRAKNRRYPLGDGRFKREFNWLGKKNELGQIYIVRNCFFEPVAWGEHQNVRNWVDNCLKEIAIAFQWNKPAVISSHRVNYIGFIDPRNREKGLKALRVLLQSILKKWPEVEFMTTMELGDLISKPINSILF